MRPETTAQLAAAFLISMCFLLVQIKVRPFLNDKDNDYQMYSMVSIVLTLFAGEFTPLYILLQ